MGRWCTCARSPRARSCRTSVTTSAARCSRRPSGWRTRATASSSSTSATRRRSASRRPTEILVDVIRNLPTAQGYGDSQGPALGPARGRAALPAARHRRRRRRRRLPRQRRLRADRRWRCRRCSTTATRCSSRRPDYPLWTAAVEPGRRHAGALPLRRAGRLAARPRRHRARRSPTATKAIVVINPNNPTGAVYPREVLEAIAELARRARPDRHAPTRSTTRSSTTTRRTPRSPRSRPTCSRLTFNGLSKAYRVAGFRSGWLVVTGPEGARAQLPRGPRHPGQHAAVRQRARRSTRSRSRSAATRRSTTWSCPAAGCSSSATSRGSCSTRSPASRASSRRARSTCSRGSTRRSTRSTTTSSSSSTCCASRSCSSCRAPASTGRTRPLPDRHPAAGRGPRGRDRSPREVPLDVLPVVADVAGALSGRRPTT